MTTELTKTPDKNADTVKHAGHRTTKIWAVAGGKGGTGKSFIASLLGLHLAIKGKKVIMLDADYEGANLHSFLEIKKTGYTLTDFFKNKIPLADLVLATNVPNLKLIIGDIYSFDPRGFSYSQKLKLFRHIKKLAADVLIIDLGAGSGVNVIDTFLLADRKIVTSTPQTISVENLYHFLDRAMFRKLDMELDRHGLRSTADEAMEQREDIALKTFRETVYYLATYSDQIRVLFEKELAAFTIDIILNQVRDMEEMKLGDTLKDVLNSYYGIRTSYTGCIHYNESLWKYNNRFFPLFEAYPSCSTLVEIGKTAEKLLQGKSKSTSRDTTQTIPVFLVANTPRAVQAMNGRKVLEITHFPFKAGRLSKRKLDNFLKNNDYYFKDELPFSISRSHFAIVEHDGRFFFQDRGSRFGSIVNNIEVGGEEYNIREVRLRRGENSVRFGRKSKSLSFTLLVNEPID